MDAGERRLAELARGLVEPGWAERADTEEVVALRWWPHDLAQTVWARRDGRVVGVETEIATGVPVRGNPAAEMLRGANHAAPLAVLTAAGDGTVRVVAVAGLAGDAPELGWLRWIAGCQAADADTWSGLAEPLGGQRATSAHPRGPRELPGVVLGVADDVVERSWARQQSVDPGWVRQGLDHPRVRWEGEGRDCVRLRWSVRTSQPERWADRDDLVVAAWLELDPSYGPALVVRTVVPLAVPPFHSAPLVRGLNARGRRRALPGLRGGWHAMADRPGVAIRTILPLGVLDDAVVAGPAVLATAVRRVTSAHLLQAREVTDVVERALPPVEGPDPWLTVPRRLLRRG